MRPLDPRLVRWSGAIKGAIASTILTGCIAAAASVTQAVAAAAVVAQVFLEHATLDDVRGQLVLFTMAWLARSLAVTAQDVLARTAGLRAVASLRRELAVHYAESGVTAPSMLALMGRGIDALEVYVARYLPQLVLAILVPLGLGAWILAHDAWTALVLVITIPLIPFFMALIGWFTDAAVTRQWAAVGRITDVIDDLFAGLPDLVLFQRAQAQAALIRRLGNDATHATMRVLRLSFMSSLALELIATISVAVVALSIGLRLTNGELDLQTGLMILILAPDVYLPLRQVGTQFHAAVEGMEAWESAQPVLAAGSGSRTLPPESVDALHLTDLVAGFESDLHQPVAAVLQRGTITAITGRSGVGKSTLLRTIAGLQAPRVGSVTVNGSPVHVLSGVAWFTHIGFVPQDPWLGHGTVRDALLRGHVASDEACRAALDAIGLDAVDLDGRVDDLGSGVSVGQRRRIALARCALRRPDVLLLDEPTAAVDAASEAAILRWLEHERTRGAIVITVAHRRAVVAAADRVLHLEAAA